MNYYAVEALLARASMYVGDTKRAEELSQDIIDKHDRSTHFPFITSQQITASEPDRVFSTEILFGLQNLNVDLLYSSLFDASRLKSESLLAPRSSIISSLYTNINDYRYRLRSARRPKSVVQTSPCSRNTWAEIRSTCR